MTDWFRKFRHALAHKFQINRGTVETWYEGEQLMVRFRCAGCRKLSGLYCVPMT